MIRTYLELQVQPGKAQALAQYFDHKGYLRDSSAQAGCHSAELTMSADGETAVVTAMWENQAAYDLWVSRPDRADGADELSSYLTEPIGPATVGRIFEVVLQGSC